MHETMSKERRSKERRGTEGRSPRKRARCRPASLGALLSIGAALVALGGGCRGTASESAPIHMNPNMDDQPYVEAQEPFPFFADGRGMRLPVQGTVRRGASLADREAVLREDDPYWRGRAPGTGGESFTVSLPVPLTKELLDRGRERYTIYCAVCHDATGGGDGVVVRRGMVTPPAYDDQRLLAMPVGQIFDVITNGARNMQPYAAQIPVADRWAIVAWVRALQVARTATLEDVPAEVRREKGWGDR